MKPACVITPISWVLDFKFLAADLRAIFRAISMAVEPLSTINNKKIIIEEFIHSTITASIATTSSNYTISTPPPRHYHYNITNIYR